MPKTDNRIKWVCAGCSGVIAIGAIWGLIIGLAGTPNGGGVSEPVYYQHNEKSFDEMLEEMEFTGQDVSEQNSLIDLCIAEEVSRGLMTQKETDGVTAVINDRSDEVFWKSSRLLLLIHCVEKEYGQ